MPDTHSCQALVLTCIDFRFNQQIIDELRRRGIEKFDLKTDAGGVKYLISPDKPAVRDWILENIEIAKRLHHIDKIVLINHSDCGAYGGNKTWASDQEQLEFQAGQLRAASDVLHRKFPDLAVERFFAVLQGQDVVLEPV